MRSGVNPEKEKREKNLQKQHRVVVVFYIPNLTEDYYKESVGVLVRCLDSLVKTINYNTTNITLINNNSVEDADKVVQKYIKNNQIDKYIFHSENKGKVNAVINEVRGVYEPFVTIADCDVLFLSGWEKAVFNIFSKFPKAGVVTPLPFPYGAFQSNASIFFNNFFLRKIKYKKIVADEDIELYINGVNNKNLIKRSSKYNWKEKQYFLDGDIQAIVGATHFVATYRTSLFKNENTFPKMKFINGYETEFIDILSDKKGFYRLSTLKTYAYHMGNNLDEFSKNHTFKAGQILKPQIFDNIKNSYSFVPFWIRKVVFKIIKKLY